MRKLILCVCGVFIIGAGALLLSSSGAGAGTGPQADAGVEYVDELPGDRVCEALASFGNDRLRLRRFTRAVRSLTHKRQVAVAWLMDADSTADKDKLARSLVRAGFTVEVGRFESGVYGITAARSTRLDVPALEREKDALLQASAARSDRMTLMVAYPLAGCEDVGPDE